MWLVLLAVALVAVACAMPYEQILRFRARDQRLLSALGAARNQLVDSGVVLAKQIVITNQGYETAIPVEFASGSDVDGELQDLCENDNPDLNACTIYRDKSYTPKAIYVRESIGDGRIDTVVLHEMIHALFPGIQHLGPDQVGVFTVRGNSPTLTADDLALIAEYTEVV